MNLPNCLSLLRLPLALVFLQTNPLVRAGAIVLAMISDGLDGYLARRFNQVSRLGTVLDPLADKFFVMFALYTFISEGQLSWLDAALFISRDFSVVLYGAYLALRKRLMNYTFRAIWCGKITTVLQMSILLSLSAGLPVPDPVYTLFVVLGVAALVELYLTDRSRRKAAV